MREGAVRPSQGSDGAAGFDLYACIDKEMEIRPGQTEMVPTGWAMEIPYGAFGAVYPRSGLATKKGLRLANCVGVIDSDYRGEVQVPLYNDSEFIRRVEPGERVAQIIFQSYFDMDINEVDELETTQRGVGGFGSTGRK